jgi:hypothetical protein
MRTTRLSASLSLAALLAMPALVHANCYSIYDTQNRLTFQSTVAPIDLSTRISEGMRTSFPGAFFIMIPDDSDCREIRTGATLSPRFDAGSRGQATAPEELLQASPLLRSGRSVGAASDGVATGNAIATREAVRSGNALNIKRERP